MVRTIVALLVRIGTRQYPPEIINECLQYNHRSQLHIPTAPAHGLYLVNVHYPGDEIDISMNINMNLGNNNNDNNSNNSKNGNNTTSNTRANTNTAPDNDNE
jgi:tRNA U38,U39,U40 pseudouridine synthase TruA